MANQKPKKTGKKNSQPEPKKDLKETKEVKETKDVKETKTATAEAKTTTTVASASSNPLKGFFARKYGEGENILTIFKTPKIWGALLGELLGTFLITAVLLLVGTFGGMFQYAIYLAPALIFIYIMMVKVSGANFNPLITAGMMATRRMSAIRGILYMLAQLLGAWLALIIVNAFRLGSGTAAELPIMNEVTGENFWTVALIELIGAIILGVCFARAIRYSKRNALTFAFAVVSSLIFVVVIGATISQGFFQYSTSFTFNPVVALMYQILPTAADNLGELAQMAGLAAAAYIVFPVVGGIVGFYLSDIMTRLAGDGYGCEIDNPVCAKLSDKK